MHTKRLRLLLQLTLLVGLLFGAAALYVSDYYHAVPTEIPSERLSDGSMAFRPSPAADLHVGLIFYPGGKVESRAYAPLMEQLAERGITCFLLEMPHHLAILDVDRAQSIRTQYPEIGKWLLAGHSMGGMTAAMDLAENTSDYAGLILLAAYSTADLSQSGIPVLSIYGSNDGVLNRGKYEADKEKLPADFTEIMIEGSNHACFGSYGAQDGDGVSEISCSEQQARTADIILEWLRKQ